MKLVALAASSSRQSINKQPVIFAAGLLPNVDIEILDINDHELPLFCVHREAEIGPPID